ncbi:hypothetical protein BC628DRAFT_438975 [Trametes gibbosa]|nr:hypothetical protein BC628DRAFT_438975 [Trametes gibbosa]
MCFPREHWSICQQPTVTRALVLTLRVPSPLLGYLGSRRRGMHLPRLPWISTYAKNDIGAQGNRQASILLWLRHLAYRVMFIVRTVNQCYIFGRHVDQSWRNLLRSVVIGSTVAHSQILGNLRSLSISTDLSEHEWLGRLGETGVHPDHTPRTSKSTVLQARLPGA